MKIQKMNSNALIQDCLTEALSGSVSKGFSQAVDAGSAQAPCEELGKMPGERGNVLTMYSVQTKEVLETLEKEGVNYVKKAYIDKKYGESAWIFRTAYDFFCSEAVNYLKKPDEAESPVWMFMDPRRAQPSPDAHRLRLKIPRNEVLLFDLRSWSSILNLSLVGSEEEKKAFEKELARQGITKTQDIMKTGFYPLLKRRITESWKRLFTAPLPEDTYVQGAAWFLKKEWVEEVD